jgi:hypothetical protein
LLEKLRASPVMGWPLLSVTVAVAVVCAVPLAVIVLGLSVTATPY